MRLMKHADGLLNYADGLVKHADGLLMNGDVRTIADVRYLHLADVTMH